MKATIDSQQLRVFIHLAKTLNMSRTAAEMGLTPSGVSHCLKALEKDLGCRLFERSSQKVELAQAGQKFLVEAEKIAALMKHAREMVRDAREWTQTCVNIAASPTISRLVLPPVWREFRGSFPGVGAKIVNCGEKQAAEWVREGKIDMAIIVQPLADIGGMEFLPLAEDDLRFIVNPLHPWALKRVAQHQEIAGANLILPERESISFQMIDEYFRKERIRIAPFVEVSNEEAIKGFVQLDLGVGILPAWAVSNEMSEGSLVALPIGRRRLKRVWGVLRLRSRKPSFSESLLVNICRSVLRGLIANE